MEDWREYRLTCSRCKYHNLIADAFPEKQTCPNMDYTKWWFYAPYFVSHCTGEHHPPCKYFQPASCYIRLYEDFTDIYDWIEYNAYMLAKTGDKSYYSMSGHTSFYKAGNRKTAGYTITEKDFFNGTYLDSLGNLKCMGKFYYKIDRSAPLGFRLIHEWIGQD